MPEIAARLSHEQPGTKPWLGGITGGICGAVAAIVPLTVFFPLGRLFDPSVGGDPRGSLATELLVGFVLGVVICPVSAGVGAVVGRRLQLGQLGGRHHAALGILSVTIGVGIFVALNGGFIDERGSTDSLQFVIALSVLAWFVGVGTYSLVRQPVRAAMRRSSTGAT